MFISEKQLNGGSGYVVKKDSLVPEESEEAENEMISLCIDLYEKAEEENKSADLETIRSIVNRLGENGYTAVDNKNPPYYGQV